ncbi:Transcription factor [Stylosanthes scabra]|uniref:WRKY transcription factor n=1 Tax=Stylosanthes scabra TaxID=79078 RepID=A0ABU6U8I8_9FABA|nr:Transcription factor [Stylosanthes scabra]
MEKDNHMGVKSEEADAVSFGSSNGYYNINPLLLSSSSAFDFCQVEKSELGFMELLGVQDYCNSGGAALLDLPHFSKPTVVKASCDGDSGKECSEVLNHQHQQPATPNSSSISLASSEAVNDEHNKSVEQGVHDDDDDYQEEQQQKKTKKQLKVKKTKQKRQREARFAFMTKSEVDHLEDGYRWRKYGQKAVKNSPFPRSYYRCTSASCNVKKRVERSFTDPSVVVTTYEGQHTHPSPVMPRSPIAGSLLTPPPQGVSSTNFASLMPGNYLSSQYHHHHQQQLLANTLTSFGFPYKNTNNNNINNASFSQDNGLLQDILPSNMLKEY